jgi:hypothetical protein
MNSDTGHLVRDLALAREMGLIKEDEAKDYEPVPAHLHGEAMRRLEGKEETYVPKRSRTPLARHATARRKARKKAAKQARKRQRG